MIIELRLAFQRAESFTIEGRIQLGASLLTALIYLGSHFSR